MPKKRTPRKRPESRADAAPAEPLPIKALYSIGDLSKALSIPWRRLKKLLSDCGVTFMRAGRAWLVPLSEIETHAPALWDKIAPRRGGRNDAD